MCRVTRPVSASPPAGTRHTRIYPGRMDPLFSIFLSSSPGNRPDRGSPESRLSTESSSEILVLEKTSSSILWPVRIVLNGMDDGRSQSEHGPFGGLRGDSPCVRVTAIAIQRGRRLKSSGSKGSSGFSTSAGSMSSVSAGSSRG